MTLCCLLFIVLIGVVVGTMIWLYFQLRNG